MCKTKGIPRRSPALVERASGQFAEPILTNGRAKTGMTSLVIIGLFPYCIYWVADSQNIFPCRKSVAITPDRFQWKTQFTSTVYKHF
jgi:hypothetical protein